MNKHFALTALVLGTALATTACGRPFDVKTPPGLVELDDQAPDYDYRASAPEGVVKPKSCFLCSGSRLFLVETGGPKEEVTRYQQALDWAEATIKLD
jgi:hypothetical protein